MTTSTATKMAIIKDATISHIHTVGIVVIWGVAGGDSGTGASLTGVGGLGVDGTGCGAGFAAMLNDMVSDH